MNRSTLCAEREAQAGLIPDCRIREPSGFPRPKLRTCYLHLFPKLPNERVFAIQNSPIASVLIFEDSGLGVPIFVQIAIAIEMIVTQIQMNRDLRFEPLDGFKPELDTSTTARWTSRPIASTSRGAEISADEGLYAGVRANLSD